MAAGVLLTIAMCGTVVALTYKLDGTYSVLIYKQARAMFSLGVVMRRNATI